MAALNTDLVRNATPNFATTLANSMLSTDTTMTLQSTTGLPTATAITLVIDATDPISGASTPTLKETVTGVVSGSTVTSLVRGLDSTTAQAHASGANVVMWITANLWNDFQASYLTQHSQLGTHTGITATSITNSGNYNQAGGTFTVPNNTVGAAALATNAITLGSISIATTPAFSNTSYVLITGVTVQVTVPAGGRGVEIDMSAYTIFCNSLYNLAIYRGTTAGALTTLIQDFDGQAATYTTSLQCFDTPSAGTYYYSLACKTTNGANAVNVAVGSSNSVTLVVKAI